MVMFKLNSKLRLVRNMTKEWWSSQPSIKDQLNVVLNELELVVENLALNRNEAQMQLTN